MEVSVTYQRTWEGGGTCTVPFVFESTHMQLRKVPCLTAGPLKMNNLEEGFRVKHVKGEIWACSGDSTQESK
jgi:hypothetical protein